MNRFRKNSREVIGNSALQSALGKATGLLSERRKKAFESLENAGQYRDKTRQAKLTVLENLDRYLEEFESRLIANGVHVHWAETGAEANGIVSSIASNRSVQRIIKSKSMATEEIGLNEHLESSGFRVVETDLGEYIIQLAGEMPSHIVAPVIHMSRDEVGEIFRDKLELPYTNDPNELTKLAREKLREEFISAEMGITGANFGVAETGTICLVTNEGNGRMTTTLPKIHVVVMGIEKLVPAMADLDSALKVLARSATGQKITVYTTLINGPAKSGEDGPEEVHVILLDNGRSRTLTGDHAEILACIRCGACMNACPVYNAVGGHAYDSVYPGPMGSVVTPCLKGAPESFELPHASTLCGACKEVCPVSIDLPGLLVNLRESSRPPKSTIVSNFELKLGLNCLALFAEYPKLYRMVRKSVVLLNRFFARNGWFTKLPGIAGNWTESRDLKAPAKRSFHEMWEERNE